MGFRGQPPYQLVVQTCHFAVACAMAQLAVTCGLPGRYGLAWTLVFALAKEYGYDLVVELDSVAGSTLDLAFYALGLLACFVTFLLAGRF